LINIHKDETVINRESLTFAEITNKLKLSLINSRTL